MAKQMKSTVSKTILIVVVSLILTVIIASFMLNSKDNYITTSFSIQFEGIERGISPDNTRLDYNDIVSDTVIQAAFRLAEVEYKDDYEANFEVIPILPIGIEKTLEKSRKEGEDYTYFPNEFMVKIKLDPAIGLDKVKSEKVADAYKEAYETYFKKKYSYPFRELDQVIAYLEYEKYDYPEYIEIFKNEFNIIYSYLRLLDRDDPEFKSEAGYTFMDIKEAVNRVEKYDLNKIDALISKYQLTKDNSKLKIKYAYMLRRYDLEKNKNAKNYQVSNELLSIVKNNEKDVIVPGLTDGTVSITLVNDNYDTLAEKATKARTDSTNINSEILRIQRELEKINNPSPEYQAKMRMIKNEVDTLSSDLQADIDGKVELIAKVVDEYFDYKYNNVVTLVHGAEEQKKFSNKQIAMIFLVSLCLSTVIVALMPNKRKIKKVEQTETA